MVAKKILESAGKGNENQVTPEKIAALLKLVFFISETLPELSEQQLQLLFTYYCQNGSNAAKGLLNASQAYSTPINISSQKDQIVVAYKQHLSLAYTTPENTTGNIPMPITTQVELRLEPNAGFVVNKFSVVDKSSGYSKLIANYATALSKYYTSEDTNKPSFSFAGSDTIDNKLTSIACAEAVLEECGKELLDTKKALVFLDAASKLLKEIEEVRKLPIKKEFTEAMRADLDLMETKLKITRQAVQEGNIDDLILSPKEFCFFASSLTIKILPCNNFEQCKGLQEKIENAVENISKCAMYAFVLNEPSCKDLVNEHNKIDLMPFVPENKYFANEGNEPMIIQEQLQSKTGNGLHQLWFDADRKILIGGQCHNSQAEKVLKPSDKHQELKKIYSEIIDENGKLKSDIDFIALLKEYAIQDSNLSTTKGVIAAEILRAENISSKNAEKYLKLLFFLSNSLHEASEEQIKFLIAHYGQGISSPSNFLLGTLAPSSSANRSIAVEDEQIVTTYQHNFSFYATNNQPLPIPPIVLQVKVGLDKTGFKLKNFYLSGEDRAYADLIQGLLEGDTTNSLRHSFINSSFINRKIGNETIATACTKAILQECDGQIFDQEKVLYFLVKATELLEEVQKSIKSLPEGEGKTQLSNYVTKMKDAINSTITSVQKNEAVANQAGNFLAPASTLLGGGPNSLTAYIEDENSRNQLTKKVVATERYFRNGVLGAYVVNGKDPECKKLADEHNENEFLRLTESKQYVAELLNKLNSSYNPKIAENVQKNYQREIAIVKFLSAQGYRGEQLQERCTGRLKQLQDLIKLSVIEARIDKLQEKWERAYGLKGNSGLQKDYAHEIDIVERLSKKGFKEKSLEFACRELLKLENLTGEKTYAGKLFAKWLEVVNLKSNHLQAPQINYKNEIAIVEFLSDRGCKGEQFENQRCFCCRLFLLVFPAPVFYHIEVYI